MKNERDGAEYITIIKQSRSYSSYDRVLPPCFYSRKVIYQTKYIFVSKRTISHVVKITTLKLERENV